MDISAKDGLTRYIQETMILCAPKDFKLCQRRFMGTFWFLIKFVGTLYEEQGNV